MVQQSELAHGSSYYLCLFLTMSCRLVVVIDDDALWVKTEYLEENHSEDGED